MHKTNNYCDIQDGCKLLKEKEFGLRILTEFANDRLNEIGELKLTLANIQSRFGIKVITYGKESFYYCSRIAKLEQALRDILKILYSKVIPIRTAREKEIIAKIRGVLNEQ